MNMQHKGLHNVVVRNSLKIKGRENRDFEKDAQANDNKEDECILRSRTGRGDWQISPAWQEEIGNRTVVRKQTL
jgi:hypothetical protein